MSNRSPDALNAIDAVLFDLDGTLVDTAPDMVGVLIELQNAHDIDPVPYELGRASVSNGGAALIKLAFPDASEAARQELLAEYLVRYQAAICNESSLFPDLPTLLDLLEKHNRPWGVVTNKPERMTLPLLSKLGLDGRFKCAVSGDTIPQRKPDPAPLLLASRLTGVAPERSVYIGDAQRDIQAGRAAGMATIAAAYGYVTDDDDPARWQADYIVADTKELTTMILKAVNLTA